MAITLIATPGAVDANSYTTVDEANSYHATHLYGSAWGDAGVEEKKAALITATRVLEERVTWVGWPTGTSQKLAWPRSSVPNRNLTLVQNGVLPQELKEATAELARTLFAAGAMPGSGGDIQAGLTGLKVGPIDLKFDAAMTGADETMIPAAVWAMIKHLVERSTRSAFSVPLVRT